MPNFTDPVTVYPLGASFAYTTAGFFANVMIQVGDRRIFVDCPPYLPRMLEANSAHGEIEVTLDDYREVIITHMHTDHVGGLEELAYLNMFEPVMVPKVYGPIWLLEDIWTSLRPSIGWSYRGDGGLAEMNWYFEPCPIENPHDFGDFTLSTMLTRHIPDTLALKFDFGNLQIGFSSDTGFKPDLIEWLSDCDMIMHDAWVGPLDSFGGNMEILHTPLADLMTLPPEFQRKTFLHHYDDSVGSTDYDIGEYRFLEHGKAYKVRS